MFASWSTQVSLLSYGWLGVIGELRVIRVA